jgi:hypothetical protein
MVDESKRRRYECSSPFVRRFVADTLRLPMLRQRCCGLCFSLLRLLKVHLVFLITRDCC